MADLTYKDYIPANARVLVDYTKPPQDRVKFSYPERMSYKKALWKFGFPSFRRLTDTIFILLSAYLFEFFIVFEITSALIKFMANPTLGGAMLTAAPLTASALAGFGIAILAALSLTMLILFWIPALLTWYYGRDKEKLANILPKMNYQLTLLGQFSRVKYLRITPKDIQENGFILPHFSNVFLNYNATGQMSTNLKKVRVMDYPYNYYIKKPNGKLSRKQVNHFDFMAIFEFKTQPKNGYIDVEWI